MAYQRIKRFFDSLLLMLRWSGISAIVGLFAGGTISLLLIALERATSVREQHWWIIYFLPVAGFAMGWIYSKVGTSVERGKDLLLDEIHDPKASVPFRMAPLIFLSTIVSVLFGGSVGREGTAVQMGGSLADRLTKPFGLNPEQRKVLLISGLSAGFSAIFGAPLAGAIFGLEVLSAGGVRSSALFPSLIASIVSYQLTLFCGIHFTPHSLGAVPPFALRVLVTTVIAGIIFGVVGWCFSTAVHKVHHVFRKRISYAPLRPFIGGCLIVLLYLLLPIAPYLGLGVAGIDSAFVTNVHPWDFLGKLGLTALTLGSGFKGGELTPLFYIGSNLGNSLSPLLGMSRPVLAALGYVAVFAGVAHTPITSTLLAIEIFGPEIGLLAAVASATSYLFSGSAKLYQSQRVEDQNWRSAS